MGVVPSRGGRLRLGRLCKGWAGLGKIGLVLGQ